MFGHLNFVDESPQFDACRCSLCHTLGAEYGYVARLFTNYDLALTALVALASDTEQPTTRRRICPVFSRKQCMTGNANLQQFLAAVTIILTAEKVRDDEHDEGVIASRWALRWLEKCRKRADDLLRQSGFDPNLITDAFHRQRLLERQGTGDIRNFAQPTAEVMSAVYAHAAHISGKPETVEAMRMIGAALGEIIYLLDSITDYVDDLRTNSFNSLNICAASTSPATISPAARVDLKRLFADCCTQIRLSLEEMNASPALRELLTVQLQSRLDGALQQSGQSTEAPCLSFIGRLTELSPISLLFFPRLAFAADGRSGGGCIEPLIPLVIMLFGLNCVVQKLCGHGICGREKPEKITVRDGCFGKKTYKRDPCTGKYKEDGC